MSLLSCKLAIALVNPDLFIARIGDFDGLEIDKQCPDSSISTRFVTFGVAMQSRREKRLTMHELEIR
jgi:hypothetical protein